MKNPLVCGKYIGLFSFFSLFLETLVGHELNSTRYQFRHTQGARASEHLTLSKHSLWQERQHCEDQGGCLAFAL